MRLKIPIVTNLFPMRGTVSSLDIIYALNLKEEDVCLDLDIWVVKRVTMD